MTDHNKIGVMVPVYNMGKFLDRCISSVLGDESVGEIIIVNDGSTDETGDICKKIQMTDKRICVITTDHVGLVAARNIAIDRFSTDYITFVDADDWIEKGMLDDSLNYLERHSDIDIFINGLCRDDGEGCKKMMFMPHDKIEEFGHENAIVELLKGDYYRWELCGKVYKSSLLRGWKADENVIRGEDLDRNWIIFNKADKVAVNCNATYHYYYNPDSMVNTPEIMLYSMYEIYGKLLKSSYDSLQYARPYLIKHAYREVVTQIKRLCCDGIEKNKEQILIYQSILKGFSEEDIKESRSIDIYGYIDVDYELEEAIEIYGDIERLKKLYFDIKNTISTSMGKIYVDPNALFFYGTGAVANYIVRIAKKQNLNWNGFIVSDLELKKNRFCNRPVLRVSEVKDKENVVVVLALNEKNEEVVRENLYNNGFKHVISLVEPLNGKYRVSDWI